MNTEVTHLLMDLCAGNRSDFDRLLSLVYQELQDLAHNHLRHERSDHTLNTNALVHEAYLKLVDQKKHRWESRAHFFGAASNAMRRILVDYARGKRRDKRKGHQVSLTLAESIDQKETLNLEDLISLDQAMIKLSALNERYAKVVECRFFGGLSVAEVAEALSISHMTVSRDWRFARAWLLQELSH